MTRCLIPDEMHTSRLRGIGVEGDYQPRLMGAAVPAGAKVRRAEWQREANRGEELGVAGFVALTRLVATAAPK